MAANGRSTEFSYLGEVVGTTPDRMMHLVNELRSTSRLLSAVISERPSLVHRITSTTDEPEVLRVATASDVTRVAAELVRGESAFLELGLPMAQVRGVLLRHGYREVGESDLTIGADHAPLFGSGDPHFDQALAGIHVAQGMCVLHSAHDADPLFLFHWDSVRT